MTGFVIHREGFNPVNHAHHDILHGLRFTKEIKMDDDKKQAFIAEYQELCTRHGLMVTQAQEDEGSEYMKFALADITQNPKDLDKAVDELIDSEVSTLKPESPESR